MRIRVPGEHMALNSAAALLAGLELGLPPPALIDGLARFGGVHRRFELKGIAGRRAGLRRLRPPPDRGRAPSCGPPARSPAAAGWSWRSSRTCTAGPASSPRASAQALGLADDVVVMEVYGAREDPVPGVTGALVADAVPLPPGPGALRAVVVGGGARRSPPRARPGDLVRDDGRRRRLDGRARGPRGAARRAGGTRRRRPRRRP